MTQLYGVVGDPIAHSLSPLIHRGWMRDHKLPADYLAMQVQEGAFKESLGTLEGKGFLGLNITLPHKISALEFASKASDRARAIGAVNTLWRDDIGHWQGDNTDAPGFQHALRQAFCDHNIEQDTMGNALVLGAGGSARSVAYAFGESQQKAVFCNRTLARAEALRPIFRRHYLPVGDEADFRACGLDALASELEICDFAINTTSLGYSGGSFDWPAGRGRLIYDLSYGKIAENFLAPARLAGWQTVDGLGMLVAQAAFSFEIWFGMKPDMALALERCHHVLDLA